MKRIIIERAEFVNRFKIHISRFEPKDRRLLYYHGSPGTGKTTLLFSLKQCVKDIYDKKASIIDWDFEQLENHTQFNFTVHLYRNFVSQTNADTWRFNVARYFYQKVYHKDSIGTIPLFNVQSSSFNILLKEMGNLADELTPVKLLNSVIRIVKNITKKQDFELEIDALIDYKLEDMSEIQLQEVMLKFLLEDIEEYCNLEFGRVFLFLDTYEKLNSDSRHNNNTWLVKEVIQKAKGIFFLVFGTQNNAFARTDLREPYYNSLEDREAVSGLSLADSLKLLSSSNMKDDILNLILSHANGNPAILTTLKEVYDKIASKGDIPQYSDFTFENNKNGLYDATYSIYEKHLTEAEKSVIGFLSEFDSWDEELFYFACSASNVNNLDYELFIQHCMVENVEKNSLLSAKRYWHRFIDVSRNYFENYNSSSKKAEIYNASFLHFKKKISEIKISITDLSKYDIYEYYAISTTQFGLKMVNLKPEKFEIFSDWFIAFEQSLSPMEFYYLKTDVLNLFVDYFHFDVDIDKNSANAVTQCYYDLSWGYYFIKNHYKALDIMFKCFLLSQKHYLLGDEKITKCLYSLGNITQNTDGYDTSIWYHEQALKFREKDGNLSLQGISLNSLAYTYLYRFEDENNEKDFQKAEKLFKRAINVRKKILKETAPEYNKNNYISLFRTHGNLSKLYFLKKQYDAAKDQLNLVMHYLKKAGFTSTSWEYNQTALRYSLIQIVNEDIIIYDDIKNKTLNFIKTFSQRDYNSQTTSCRNNLAVIEALDGNIEQAKEMFANCIEEKIRHYGTEKARQVIITKNNLSILKKALKHLVCASEFIEGLKLEY